MRKAVILIFGIFTLTLLSGCLPSDTAKMSWDIISGKPRVLETDPSNSNENVSTDAKIEIVFSREMDESTLNSKNVNISYINNHLKFYINPFLGSEFEYNNDEKTLTITPKEGFLPNQEVEVRLFSGVKGKNGKDLATTWRDTGSADVKYFFQFKVVPE
jgi:hypothetical protein